VWLRVNCGCRWLGCGVEMGWLRGWVLWGVAGVTDDRREVAGGGRVSGGE